MDELQNNAPLNKGHLQLKIEWNLFLKDTSTCTYMCVYWVFRRNVDMLDLHPTSIQ